MLRPLLLASALALHSVPAHAENVISLQLTPRTAQEADILRLGLALYAIDLQLRSGASIEGASIEQFGRDNAAGIGQSGGGNLGLIRQRGQGHFATLAQSGHRQTYAIFQNGRGTRAEVTQSGPATAGILFQYGW